MSANKEVVFTLRANDQASAAMQAVIAVMNQGKAAGTDTVTKFRDMATSTRLQTRAMGELRSEWAADNATLTMFGRAMSNVGAIGSTLLSITNTLLFSQLALGQSGAQVAAAQQLVTGTLMAWTQAEIQFGATDVRTLQAHNAYIQAVNQLNQAEAQAKVTQETYALGIAGIGLSVGTLTAQVITAAGGFAAFGAIISAGASSFIPNIVDALNGLGPALGPVVGGVILLLSEISTEGFAPITDAANEWVTTFNTITVPHWTAAWNTVQTTVTGAVTGVINTLTSLGWLVAKAVNTAIVSVSTAWHDFWNVTFPGAVVSAVGVVAGPVKSVLNGVIALINDFIGGIDLVISALNTIPSAIGLPSISLISTIPSLKAGGIVTSPTLAMVGEGGPEAIVPLSAGGGAASAGNTTIIIQAQGPIFTEHNLMDFIDQAMQQRYNLRRRTS